MYCNQWVGAAPPLSFQNGHKTPVLMTSRGPYQRGCKLIPDRVFHSQPCSSLLAKLNFQIQNQINMVKSTISNFGFALHHLLDKRCFAKASSFDNSTATIPARSNTSTSQTHSTRATHPKASLSGFKFRFQKKSWADLEPQAAEACWIQVLNTDTIHCMYCLTWTFAQQPPPPPIPKGQRPICTLQKGVCVCVWGGGGEGRGGKIHLNSQKIKKIMFAFALFSVQSNNWVFFLLSWRSKILFLPSLVGWKQKLV